MSGSPEARVAVVTGGGSGIGEAVCHHLARRGDAVAVLDRDGAAVERVTGELTAAGAAAVGITADVTDRQKVFGAFDEVRTRLGPVAVLVASAGLCRFTPFLDIQPDEWQEVFDVNVTGIYHCCQAAVPDMVAAGWGRIVLVSSSSAQRGSAKAPHYAAAKGAVIALTRSLALSLASQGVTVNNIPPSGIETPMQHHGQAAGDLPSNEVMAQAIPMRRLGTPDDIAATAAFLASDEAGYITGQTVGVNGGQVLS